jgi:MoxR-like ATPase
MSIFTTRRTPTPPSALEQSVVAEILAQLNLVVLGKSHQVKLALTCLLAGGHLLLEDVPGVGKTTLAQALARTLGLNFSRVQFTADLMPSDLTGVGLYNRAAEKFVFQPGPLFAQVLLADEINRANAKTQSALLEAMEERQVTVDGVSHALPKPFFVMATQNPLDHSGTYALPQSQLDRFLMRLSLGYPDAKAERLLLTRDTSRESLAALKAVVNAQQFEKLQSAVGQLHVAEPILDYLQNLLALTRSGIWFVQGLSPRAGLAILRAARAHAWLTGRDFVVPDDIQAIFEVCAAHRLVPVASAGRSANEQVRALLQSAVAA